MTTRDIGRVSLAALLLAALAYHAAPQLAHAHRFAGWKGPVTINGAVHEVNLSAPAPGMTLEDSEGHRWHVLLGSQRQVTRSGLSAAPPSDGKAAKVVGVLSDRETIRAARLIVEGREYDIPAPSPRGT